MSFIGFIILGGLAGWIASMLFGNNAEQGIVGNIIVGIIGAFLGGFIANLLGGSGVNDFNLYSLAVATGGAFVTLYIARKLFNAA